MRQYINANLANQVAAQDCARALPELAPTDMQTQVQRAHEVCHRLNRTHQQFLGLIGRLYGEGEMNNDPKPLLQPAGLYCELSDGLSDIELAAERLNTVADRLSRLA